MQENFHSLCQARSCLDPISRVFPCKGDSWAASKWISIHPATTLNHWITKETLPVNMVTMSQQVSITCFSYWYTSSYCSEASAICCCKEKDMYPVLVTCLASICIGWQFMVTRSGAAFHGPDCDLVISTKGCHTWSIVVMYGVRSLIRLHHS